MRRVFLVAVVVCGAFAALGLVVLSTAERASTRGASASCDVSAPKGRPVPRAGQPLAIAGGVVQGFWLGRASYVVHVCDARGLARAQQVSIEDVAPGLRAAVVSASGQRDRTGQVVMTFTARRRLTAGQVREWFRKGQLVPRRLPDGRRVLAEARALPFPEPTTEKAVDWFRTQP